jgi:hypothetical protein
VLGARGKSGKAVDIDDNVSGKRTARGRRIDETDPNDDNRTAKKNKTEETEEGLEQLNANLDAEAIKQLILTLDVEQRTKAKAMACWNQLARGLTVRFTDNKHQGLTIEEEEVKAHVVISTTSRCR